jgi:HEAT repeat protein
VTSSAGSAGVFTTDVALVVQSWDGWLAAATGITEEEARGRPLGELFPELESRGLLARLRHVSESGEVAVLAPAFHEYLLPCPPRARATHFARMQQHVTLAPLRAADAIVGVMVTLEDVTARRDRERELARQLKSDDESERLHAARELAESEGAGQLVAALGDRSWRVRRAAVDGLSIERDDAAIDALVAAVRERHRDPAVLNAALSALVHTDRDVVPRLAPLMDDEDADVRTYAALALGLLEDTRGVTRLVAALDDENANVRFHAIEALGRIGSREAALPLAAVAESRDFSVAFAALDALAHIGEPSVAPRLVPLLDDDLLQAAAAEALGALGGPEATGPLARLLDGADAPVEALATALVALDERQGDDAALVPEMVRRNVSAAGTRALVDALPRAAESTRPAIVRVLGWLDGDGIDDVLAGALADPATCAVASDALVSRGARAVEPLVQVLESERGSDAGGDADDLAHRAAAAALGRLGAASAVPALIALLDDAPDVAVVAAGALGHIGDRRAFEPLLAALDHPHAALRQVAVSALNSLGHPELTERLPALLRDSSPRVREAAARVAGYLGDPALLDAMLALHADDDETVQRAAVEQLVRFEDPRATAAVADALAHGTPAVRAAAARALAHGEPRDAIARLTAACDDPDPWVRYYAARSLGHVGRHSPREAARVLVALAMHDPVPPVRIAALDALATLGEVAEAGALRTIADDPDPAVAAPALAALGASRGRDTLEPLLAALGHADRVRRLAALDALARRADADAVPAAAAVARHSSDSEERTRGLEVLAATDDERAVAALVDVARDPRRTGTVVATLATLPETRIPWLRRALDDGDVHLRCALIEGLGRMRHRAASVLLAEALREPHPAVHAAAAHALGRADLRATSG